MQPIRIKPGGAVAVIVLSLGMLVPLAEAKIRLSTLDTATLGGLVNFEDADVVDYDPDSNVAVEIFSEDKFSADEDIDGLHILPNGNFILSTLAGATINTVPALTFLDGDLVEYNPTTNTASIYMGETGRFAQNENIDAVAILPNGHLVLSTEDGATLNGLTVPAGGTLTFLDGDLVEYDPVAKTASIFLSESIFTANENIDAVHILPNGHILLSTLSDAGLDTGLTFKDGDLVKIDPLTGIGALYFAESKFSANENIDAVYVPEPMTLLMLLAGGLMFVPRLRRP